MNKRPKKRWAWTKKSLRRNQHRKALYGYCAPNYYRKEYNKKYDTQTKKAITKELNGQDGDFPSRTRKHQAGWDFW